jgi:threonine synthase
MLYYSTNRKSEKVDFRQATIQGQAPDGGLYFPESIPAPLQDNLQNFLSPADLAFRVIKPYVGHTIPDEELFQICGHTLSFGFPLVQVSDNIYSLELFHGPTLAFKDVGARFMSRCLGYFSRNSNRKITVLVATSGDTGSAVANGFLGVEGVEVVILYPSGKVSKVQELQLTTLGQNIRALEVQGTFDDCQRMVKQAFADAELNKKLFLTSANSINVARWLPQQFYYFLALQQWPHSQPPVICVPSGNFGNICAGLLAALTYKPQNAAHNGWGVQGFVAACNSNDIFTQYIQTAKFEPRQAVATISNAMDVGNPSNFVRILELFNNRYEQIKDFISSYTISDTETFETIARVFKQHGYILDPHGAVGYRSLEKHLEQHPAYKGLFLETAHPIKFSDVVEKAIGQTLQIPESMQYLLKLKKQSVLIKPEYSELREFLNG